ncbi:hypothetical protein RSAG8_08131, partial [Rhizoctonia solani AG-8 WAC10335]
MIVYEGHTLPVTSVAFSPDGKSVASGSGDNTIRMWDTDNPSQIGEPMTGHTSGIWSLSYSPLGNIIASGSYDKTIRLWDVNTSRQLGEATSGKYPFSSIAFSPDAKLIASGYYTPFVSNPSACAVQLWDVQRRKSASRPFIGHTSSVYSVQFSPDGTRVVSGSNDDTIRVWDVERGATILGPLEGHTDGVHSTVFSPDGSQIISCAEDGTLRHWDTRSGRMIGKPYEGHRGGILSVAFSPRGTYVVSGGQDKTVRLWDIRTGRQAQLYGDHTDQVYSVAFSPCGQYIASGSDDCKVIIRNISCDYSDSTNPLGSRIITSHMPTQQMFDCLTATGCIDLSSQMDTRQETAMIVSGGGFGDIWKGKLHNGGKVAIKTWRTNTLAECGDKALKFWFMGQNNPCLGRRAWNNDSWTTRGAHRLVSCSFDGTLRHWDTHSGRMIGKPYEGHRGGILSFAFSPRGTYVVSGGWDHTVRLWDVRTGGQVELYEEHTDGVNSVAFSPCGQYIASGSDDRKVIIRNISCDYPDSTNPPGSQIITSHMSTQQMFDCLTSTGCIDLSSQMDTRQETAMIVSGGGFGDIWKGKLHNGGKVAIKAWRTNTLGQCSYKTLKRAARELYCWSRMEHPNIHRLQGVIMFKDQYLGMVSEWMENGNLHEYLRKYPGADRYQLCFQVASGLEYMHSRNTVHGDLKAANVLVSSDGIARLSDFDFSIMSEVSSLVFSESSNSRSGSLRWAAPEILLEEVHKRTIESDVYALGMTMLEIFTGEVPYPECRQDFTILKRVEKGTIPNRPVEKLKDQQGDMMWQLLLRCWSWNSSWRPLAGQVFDDLVSRICKA